MILIIINWGKNVVFVPQARHSSVFNSPYTCQIKSPIFVVFKLITSLTLNTDNKFKLLN